MRASLVLVAVMLLPACGGSVEGDARDATLGDSESDASFADACTVPPQARCCDYTDFVRSPTCGPAGLSCPGGATLRIDDSFCETFDPADPCCAGGGDASPPRIDTASSDTADASEAADADADTDARRDSEIVEGCSDAGSYCCCDRDVSASPICLGGTPSCPVGYGRVERGDAIACCFDLLLSDTGAEP